MNKITENKNSGFSLVELIVVIAIMAVLTSVLAPSLLSYVEKSRMQKDDSAMGEVANSIKLALADQNVYDECLTYNVTDNYSCYIDDAASSYTDVKYMVLDKCKNTSGTTVHNHNAASSPSAPNADGDNFHYNDTTRLKDEVAYIPAGLMRGMTLTFTSAGGANSAEFKMGQAKVNQMSTKDGSVASKAADLATADQKGTAEQRVVLADMTTAGGQKGQLYNKLRAQIGDSITLSSQTYRNSEYTVFIRMGSLGGNDAAAQDAIAVYGQWNGTNLTK